MIQNREMVLFSGGQNQPGQPFYHYSEELVRDYVRDHFQAPVVMISYALWGAQGDESGKRTVHTPDDMFRYGQEHWGRFGVDLVPLHRERDKRRAIGQANTLVVSGGSAHTLMHYLNELDLMPPIRARVYEGVPYIGTSAGSLVACPSIRTSSEPPLIPLTSHSALGLVGFQVSAHFYKHDRDEHHHGPTPKARILNYLNLPRWIDPDDRVYPVVGLPDGTYLHVQGRSIINYGEGPVTVFRENPSGDPNDPISITDFAPGSDLSKVLEGN